MSETEKKPASWLESLRRTGDSVLGLAQSRLELLSIEFQEEKLRALNLLAWFGVAVTLGAAGLLLILGTLALLLWSVAGYAGLIGLALLTLGGAAAVLFALRRRILNGPAPFADTVAEFRKDREWIQRKE